MNEQLNNNQSLSVIIGFTSNTELWVVNMIYALETVFCCCCCSVAKSYPALCDLMDCSTPGSSVPLISQSLLKLMSIESVMPSSRLILYRPLLLLPSIFSSISIFSNELTLCIRWPKYWSFSFSNSRSNNIQGWFPLRLTGLIALQSKGLSRIFSRNNHKKSKFWFFNLLAMRLYQ